MWKEQQKFDALRSLPHHISQPRPLPLHAFPVTFACTQAQNFKKKIRRRPLHIRQARHDPSSPTRLPHFPPSTAAHSGHNGFTKAFRNGCSTQPQYNPRTTPLTRLRLWRTEDDGAHGAQGRDIWCSISLLERGGRRVADSMRDIWGFWCVSSSFLAV